MTKTWSEVRAQLELSEEDEAAIRLEYELLETMTRIREEKGLTQAQIAQRCGVKQSAIARLENNMHSPRINSLLKVLVALGYTLKIVPLEHEKK